MYRPLIAFACLALPAIAQEVDCSNALAQMDQNRCAYQDWEAADVKLNAAYGRAMDLLKGWDAEDLAEAGKGGADALKEAQRAWITFRDKTCEIEGYPMKGGSAEPLLVYGCMRQLTEDRTAQLAGFVETYAN